MSDMVPHSAPWNKRLIVTVVSCLVGARFLYNPRRFLAALIVYLTMTSYVFSNFLTLFRDCRLWPLTVSITRYLIYRYPSRFALLYALFFILTNKRDAHHTESMVSSWMGGPGIISSTLSSYLRTRMHVPDLAAIQAQAAAGTRFVFAVHPHSMFGISTLVNFALNRLVTRGVFGDSIDFRVLTINMNFWIPILREYLMARGFVCADPSTFSKLIARGISPVIVPGGAEETLLTAPGSADLILNKRMGFVREALVNNASLIPVYCFGDNGAIPVLRSWRVQKIQRLIQKWLTFATPIASLYFKRTPLHMVVGRPLAPPEDTGQPMEDRVRTYHEMYKSALSELFKSNLAEYGSVAEKNGKGIRFIK
jgi:hypothetical protein